jgi:hypothetical protein
MPKKHLGEHWRNQSYCSMWQAFCRALSQSYSKQAGMLIGILEDDVSQPTQVLASTTNLTGCAARPGKGRSRHRRRSVEPFYF